MFTITLLLVLIMMVKIKYWYNHTLKVYTKVRVYQVWLMLLIEALILIIGAKLIYQPKIYKVITEEDKRTEAINCYHSKEDLKCYIEVKVKQYGRVR